MKRSMLLLASAMLVVAVVGCRSGMGWRPSEPACCGGAEFSGPAISSYPSYDGDAVLVQPSSPTTQILPSPR
ncbi:hypothetical protein [Blastopirellula retiformator]|uniref:Lipoprotein n=1 Tax=Blastopirellula retiformator TaxID=2527970 RepID=A0A5C5UWS1_9BACT|nr:hypothetical protein [Blastopirellula retiformator]TWT30083.1 hypothetical protein Enr8_47400 [Blastopirellula retiformator]